MIRRLILPLLLVLALPAAAQRVISRIEVRGKVPASIVLSQTALIEGQSYTDADLDVAVARIRRLPFVYEAHYTVEGMTLVLHVNAMTPFYFDAEVDAAKSSIDDSSTAFFGGGARMFAGSGVVEARIRKATGDFDSRTLGLQYSHYGIGGTRLFAIGSIDWAFTNDEVAEPDPSWSVTVGYPLTIRQTLTASVMGAGFEAERTIEGFPRPLRRANDEQLLQLRWEYDTTEDPYFARRGLLAGIAATRREFDSTFEAGTIERPPAQPSIITFHNEGTNDGIAVDLQHYWPIAARGTILARADGSFDQSDSTHQQNDLPSTNSNVETEFVRLSAGYGYNFFDSGAPRESRHRAELIGSVSRMTYRQPTLSDGFDEKSLAVGYTYRRRWTTISMRFEYAFD
jgi:hypothetical protein